MPNEPSEVIQTITERDAAYNEAWAKTGIVLAPVAKELLALLINRPQMFLPFVTIVCKLMRVLGSPDNIDHWVDIAGYAELVVRDMKSKSK
jgi:hypothetical protein